MLDRALFAVRRFFLDLGTHLGSWRLSITLMVTACLYYAFLAIWATSSPPHVVENIAMLVPFWAIYVLLLVNTGVCLFQRIPALMREVALQPRSEGRQPDWEIPARPGTDAAAARDLLKSLGYRTAWEDEGRVGGIRRRWASLGTFLFHGAFFLLAAGFLLTLTARQEAQVWVAVGEEYAARPDQFLSVSPPRLLASGVPPLRFRVERITPRFWEDQLLFTQLEAELRMGPGGRETITRINRPLWVGPATYLRLSGFGFAPRYELADRAGRVIDTAFVKLNLFPPGRRDYFRIGDYPHRFYLEVFPDLAFENGRAVTRSMNLVGPGVDLTVVRGRMKLGGAVLVPEAGYVFEGLSLRFPEIRYWGQFTIVRDPGIPLIFAGYLIGLAGLILKVRGRRQEAEWSALPEGGGKIRGWGGQAPLLPPPADPEL